ncbi:Uncharacterised protein [Mycobacteroides abscessus subsp. abscessus]|nr:Uncharacterised protein [Mycobacteroides abscessus subsp. abscessus]
MGSSVGSTMRGSAQVRCTVKARSLNPAARTRASSSSAHAVIR